MATLAEMFALALQHHQVGNFRPAEQLYRDILQADPAHAEALHMLGVLTHQAGQHQEALDYLQQALTLDPGNDAVYSNLGLVHQALGQWREAAASCRQALRLQPESPAAHNNLGIALKEAGQLAAAAASFREALHLRPDYAEAHNNLGNALRLLGQLDEAIACHQQALRLRPDSPVAYNNLGAALREQGQADHAIACFQQALRLRPDFAEAHNNLGRALRDQGRLDEAVACYRQAIAVRPDAAESYFNLGTALREQGQLDDAVVSLRQVLQLRPDDAAAYTDLGGVLLEQRHPDEATQCFRKALQLCPDRPEVYSNLGDSLRVQGQLAEAIASCRHALALRPDFAEAHNNLGNVLMDEGRLDEAIAAYRQAVRLRPDYPVAHRNLAIALLETGRREEAIACGREALRLRPDLPEAHEWLASLFADDGQVPEAEAHYREVLRWRPGDNCQVALATVLPVLYLSVDEVLSARHRFLDNVARLLRDGVCFPLTYKHGQHQFYLAYLGFNERDTQRDLARLYAAPPDPAPMSPPGRAGIDRKIKVGFISACFKSHTIARQMGGFIKHLDRQAFEVTALSIGRHDDEMARTIRRNADHYAVVPANLPAARRLIAQAGLDILFYTDIGMEPVTYSLAFSRLAPVQCVTFGHPLTTGVPTIDYFISSELYEPAEADSHYTESLVRMKGLAMVYARPVPSAPLKGRDHFGLRETDHVYACLQSLFKLHPAFDEVLAGILRADPRGVLVLIQGPTPRWQEVLQQRWSATMPDVLDQIRWLPRQDLHCFLSLTAVSDVLLDTFPFGGGNTSFEALALGTPMVTLAAAFMRGRVTLGMYKKMGVLDCVAQTPKEYIDIALRLGTEPDHRAAVRAKILATCGVLYEDLEAVRELERFFQQVVSGEWLTTRGLSL